MASITRHKILVVDDEVLNVELMRAYLSNEHDVISAYNGKDALEKIKTENPDLILLDVMMPEMDGYEVCRVIRHDYQMKFIPIIMVTALTSKDDHNKGIEAGADDFLKKPVGKFELDKKISSLLRIKLQHDNLLTDRNKAYNYLDYVGVLIAVLDNNYNLVHINKKGSDFLEYRKDRVLNTNWISSFVPEKYADNVKNTYDELIKGAARIDEYHEYPLIIGSGEERHFMWYDSVLRDKEGNISNILISGEDITERKKAEVKLQDYAYQLERSNELKDLFTDILRHDLLNPAGLIRSFTEILIEIEMDERKKHIISNINESTSKLIDLIEGAAHLAKIESMEEIGFVRVDLASLLQESIENFALDIENKNIDVDTLFMGTYPALANPMIERVFSNLLSNAVKYTANESMVKISVDDAGDKWKVSFTDQGEGIPDKDKIAVFERFKRLHKDNIRGSGIGLAIVKRIVDLHHEQVGVIDNPDGKGSIFWLTLKKAQ
ncbi:sensor histidine kinase [Methanolobus halotolerans]|uniref:Hybrid sensor histidine kinase/response regulator n=1 Tax=Methanolobus halotolerans TaxID=2052935 RepID=A0A4E0PX03_9EURY|nr:response regulator [Methanolobus halotolerans]TGC09118.1 hybrid sensor histidine kinase/response regulator [Methanolobus halotolerans]